MWVYSYRTGLIEPGALTHPIAVEYIVLVFPLLIFAISLLVIFGIRLLAVTSYGARLRRLFSATWFEPLALRAKTQGK